MNIMNKITNHLGISFIIVATGLTVIGAMWADDICSRNVNEKNRAILAQYYLANKEVGSSGIVQQTNRATTEDYLVTTEKSSIDGCVEVVPHRIAYIGKDGAISIDGMRGNDFKYIRASTFCAPK